MADESDVQIFPADYLRDFTTRVFMRFGVPRRDADQASDVLANSGLRGIDSHGVAQLPLGSYREMGGHKGYGLASMVDILCRVLSGANWGPFAPPFALRQEIPKRSVGKGIGHFFGAMQIDGFIDKDEFKKQIDDWIQVFRNTKPAPGTNGPLIPGDPEREAEAIRSKQGIPLLQPVVDDLLDVSKKTGVPFHLA